jgi:hypothetical protein
MKEGLYKMETKRNFLKLQPGEKRKIVFPPPEDPEVREEYEKMKPLNISKNKLKIREE